MTKKIIFLLGLACMAALLLFAVSRMPRMGDSGAPDKTYTVQRYISRGLIEAGDESIPSDVLLNYRAFDSFAGVAVLFAALSAAMAILKRAEPGKCRSLPDVSDVESGIMPRTVTRLLIPVAVLFALFITLMGRDSLGYSLQTGVLTGGVLVLIALVFGLYETNTHISIRSRAVLEGLAVIVFIIIGIVPVFTGTPFLDFTLPGLSGTWLEVARVFMMYALDIAIGLAVAVTITSILFSMMREEKYELE